MSPGSPSRARRTWPGEELPLVIDQRHQRDGHPQQAPDQPGDAVQSPVLRGAQTDRPDSSQLLLLLLHVASPCDARCRDATIGTGLWTRTAQWTPCDPRPPIVHQPRSGLHLVEWSCELLGTALLLLGGLSAVCFNFGPNSPLRDLPDSPRLLLTGLLFAGTGSLLAVSPLGRRSGAHLNPVVTLAFWTQRHVHPHDLLGYVVAQLLGGVLGTAVVLALWGAEARAVRLGATSPGLGVGCVTATLIEAGMTALLVLVILLMTSGRRTARFTPLVLWPLVAALVWQSAAYTGTSLNPARSLGPALLAPLLTPLPVYLVGPVLGGLLAVGVFSLIKDRHVLTAKLFHDPRYPCVLGSRLPTEATGTSVHGEDRAAQKRS